MHELSREIRRIDFCMLATKREDGRTSTRPMSNNGDVEYDGDSYFFSYESSSKVSQIRGDECVTLTFTAPPSLLGKPGIFIAVSGAAEISDDKARFEEHWTGSLDRWFPEGVETPGIVLIRVSAETIQYWDGEDSGTISLLAEHPLAAT